MRPAPLVQRRRSAATPPLNALTAPAFDGYKADVWALCVTLWTLLTGQVPFGASASNPMDLFAAIEHDPLPPKPPCMSDGAYAFFRAGLTKADGERPSMRGLLVRALRPLFSRRLRPSHPPQTAEACVAQSKQLARAHPMEGPGDFCVATIQKPKNGVPEARKGVGH